MMSACWIDVTSERRLCAAEFTHSSTRTLSATS